VKLLKAFGTTLTALAVLTFVAAFTIGSFIFMLGYFGATGLIVIGTLTILFTLTMAFYAHYELKELEEIKRDLGL